MTQETWFQWELALIGSALIIAYIAVIFGK